MRTLSLGSSGSDVTLLQARLTAKGYHLVIDGQFGPTTATTVRQFQAAHGLVADGYVGPKTWDELLVDKRTPVPPSDYGLSTAREALTDRAGMPPILDRERRLAVVTRALGYEGVYESPIGSNEGRKLLPLLRDMQGRTYWQVCHVTGKPPPAWCALAVFAWVYGERPNWPMTPMKHWFGAVSQWEDWAMTGGYAIEQGSVMFHTLAPNEYAGAAFTMAREGSSSDPAVALQNGHMGLVLGRQGMEWVTVEGNVHNGVEVRTRAFGEIRLLIRYWLAEVANG